jgi:hypothetical protein
MFATSVRLAIVTVAVTFALASAGPNQQTVSRAKGACYMTDPLTMFRATHELLAQQFPIENVREQEGRIETGYVSNAAVRQRLTAQITPDNGCTRVSFYGDAVWLNTGRPAESQADMYYAELYDRMKAQGVRVAGEQVQQ